jgi:hypothetical protein
LFHSLYTLYHTHTQLTCSSIPTHLSQLTKNRSLISNLFIYLLLLCVTRGGEAKELGMDGCSTTLTSSLSSPSLSSFLLSLSSLILFSHFTHPSQSQHNYTLSSILYLCFNSFGTDPNSAFSASTSWLLATATLTY